MPVPNDDSGEGSTELTVNLEAGEYEFYCAVPGHKGASVVVRPAVKAGNAGAAGAAKA